jgi:hypothetical protein
VGATGGTGATGQTGATGPTGAATRLWAVLTSDGSLSRGFGVSGIAKTGVGTYTVIFNQSVVTCAYLATVGSTGAGTPAEGGFAVTGGDGVSAASVSVKTFDKDGTTAEDSAFHLAVFC